MLEQVTTVTQCPSGACPMLSMQRYRSRCWLAAACGAEPEYEHWVCSFGPVTVPTNCRATSYQQLHLGSALLHDKAQVASGVLRAQRLFNMVWRQHILIVVSGRGSVVVGFAPCDGMEAADGWLEEWRKSLACHVWPRARLWVEHHFSDMYALTVPQAHRSKLM